MAYTLEDTSPAMLNFCLSFANTADWHASPHPEENITSLKILIDWEEKKGILSAQQATGLRAAMARDPEKAEQARLEAIAFRETVYRVFAAVAGQQPPDQGDLDSINEVLQQGLSQAYLIEADGAFSWGWGADDYGFDCLIWPAAHSAARLLTDKKCLGMVRQCADERGCGVLFLDRTRNHSRRWCSMKTCGNRAKAQRHYQRQQAASV